MSFETKLIAFFGPKSRAAFCLVYVLPQKQCGMLSRHRRSKTARYGLRNDRIFAINLNTDQTRSQKFAMGGCLGVWDWSPQPPEAWGLGAKPPAAGGTGV